MIEAITIPAPFAGGGTVVWQAFPLVTIIGHDTAKPALLLSAVDPGLGGGIIAAHRGMGKWMLAWERHALRPH
ncbi:MAG: hypothetical protein OXE74_06345 [Cyanobacteria bacterium MAG CAR2_bin_4]|nr:hypothetical protein [Cyanobacteria bacterium MAG CAR2_bin_4]